MTIWENDYGEQFEDFDDAWESVSENMTVDDYLQYMEDHVDVRKLLQWAWKQAGFVDDWYAMLDDAETQYFKDNYHKIEVEDENDEEEE